MPVDPDRRGPGKLPLLAPMHRLHRVAELQTRTGLHFDERHRPIALRYEIDVAMPVPKSPLQYAPAAMPKPSLRHSLSHLAELLPRR